MAQEGTFDPNLPLSKRSHRWHWKLIRQKLGDWNHGGTFSHHPVACAAALATLHILQSEQLVENAAHLGPKLGQMLHDALDDHPHVGDIRGRGHFICAELVADRDTKAPFDPALKLFMKVRAQAMENGLICYPVGGNVDGVRGDIVILAPPYNATDSELAEIVEKTARSIRQVLEAEGLA